ncbi:hypothetical protein Ais01nite_13440 [Asanoa ishikariensis]|nr:hypothetical protein Ais01nite_13440 [Asanoa ishikariensis]
MSMVATIGTKAAASTADSEAALSVSSRTPKAKATGDMKLPIMEIERPAKNHRNARERSGRCGATPTREGAAVTSASDTSGHAASTQRMDQTGFPATGHRAARADERLGGPICYGAEPNSKVPAPTR